MPFHQPKNRRLVVFQCQKVKKRFFLHIFVCLNEAFFFLDKCQIEFRSQFISLDSVIMLCNVKTVSSRIYHTFSFKFDFSYLNLLTLEFQLWNFQDVVQSFIGIVIIGYMTQVSLYSNFYTVVAIYFILQKINRLKTLATLNCICSFTT